MSIEQRLQELGLKLPPAPKVLGLYRPVLITDSVLYTSGHGPALEEGGFVVGRLGDDLGVEAGQRAAQRAGLAMLASIRAELGGLERLERLIKTVGFVSSTPDFQQQPQVINGFSELLCQLMGDEAGVGARSAVGVAALPAGWAVEVEAVFQISS